MTVTADVDAAVTGPQTRKRRQSTSATRKRKAKDGKAAAAAAEANGNTTRPVKSFRAPPEPGSEGDTERSPADDVPSRRFTEQSTPRPQRPTVRDILFRLAESAANDRDSLGWPGTVGGPAAPADQEEDTFALRRKSFAVRGKRATMLAQENILSLPHPDVPVELYYKHTEATAPPPLRMSQLIAWSAKKVEPVLTEGEAERYGNLIAAIKENVVRDVLSGKINTSWYGNKKAAEYGKEPHPRNVRDRATLEEDERAIEELTRETDRWSELLHQHNRAHAEAVDAQNLRMLRHSAPADAGEAGSEEDDNAEVADAVLERFTQVSIKIDRMRTRLVGAEAYAEASEAMCEARMRCILDAFDARREVAVTDLRQLLQADSAASISTFQLS